MVVQPPVRCHLHAHTTKAITCVRRPRATPDRTRRHDRGCGVTRGCCTCSRKLVDITFVFQLRKGPNRTRNTSGAPTDGTASKAHTHPHTQQTHHTHLREGGKRKPTPTRTDRARGNGANRALKISAVSHSHAILPHFRFTVRSDLNSFQL